MELGYEILSDPPYSSGLSPTDYWFFRGKEAIERKFKELIESRDKNFYKTGILNLK